MISLREQTAPLNGLVMAGGMSARMQQDKAALDYHGKPQTEVCFDLLRPHCAEVFLSVRPDQADLPGRKGLPQLHDKYTNLGPLGGILTALDSAPDCAWLVVACDLPLLDEATIAFLVDHRDPMCQATAFRSSGDGLPEPLCTIYEPSAFNHFLGLIDKGISCPRKALQNSNTKLFDPPFFRALDNANTPQEAQQLLWWLKKGKADS